MSVRLKIALTILITGLATALGVLLTVALAFQRMELETAYQRADVFLGRVVTMYDDLLDLHERRPEELTELLKSLLLFEPDTQLYLLAADGRVLTHTGKAKLGPDFRVTLAPVQQAAEAARTGQRMPYVMGDDPERMESDTVIAARPLSRAEIRRTDPLAGYLYLVCHKPAPSESRMAAWRSTLSRPAMVTVAAVVALTTLLAAWIIASVTRPLRRLSEEVARAAREGLGSGTVEGGEPVPAATTGDEFERLRGGFRTMLATLRLQWETLRRLDHFRRESVSNLSHDLRSPLTATAACLETLEHRWAGDPGREEERRLVEIALRNTRNAAQLVRSLGDLAQLDEPSFQLHTQLLDVSEVLDDIVLRFTERAAQQGVRLHCETPTQPAHARVDVELFERAIANLVDNALKFTPAGGLVLLQARSAAPPGGVEVCVSDSGSGIPLTEQTQLFDRFYQSPAATASLAREGGQGLGLAIVKRIVELHRGSIAVKSEPGVGTAFTITLPAA